MAIPLQPIESSLIHSCGYDPATKTLAVQFMNGDKPGPKIYHYSDVEPEVYEGLRKAPSAGVYFGRLIRGKYTHTPVDVT